MKKSLLFGALGAITLGVAVYATSALAAVNDNRGFGPNYTPERHTQMEKALESNDYATWKNLMGDRGAARVITADNFSRFAEMHTLREAGKIDDANKIRTELGLGTGDGSRNGRGVRHNGSGAQNKFVDANGDGKCDRLQ
ncbi:MAG: hypothetical protein WCG84_02290 [Candidatus Moraniibacteriota bacterium]